MTIVKRLGNQTERDSYRKDTRCKLLHHHHYQEVQFENSCGFNQPANLNVILNIIMFESFAKYFILYYSRPNLMRPNNNISL